MTYGDFKKLLRRTIVDKILLDKAFNIANFLKYDGYQRGLASMVYKFFDRKTALLARSETLATRDKYSSNTNKGQ